MWLTEYFHQSVGFTFKVKESLFHRISPFQTVDIVETESYGRMLLLDGMVMTTEKDEFIYHELIAHIPLLAHPEPKRVLIIGDGDGGVAREIVKHPSVEEVTVCEIDKMVVEACQRFLPTTAIGFEHPKVTVHIEDGISYLSCCLHPFDVVIVASADPVGPGVGLFTEAFYRNVRGVLTEEGILVAQSGSPWAMPSLFQEMHQSLKKVFPIVQPYVSVIPTYPGSFWSWMFCSKNRGPLEYNRERVDRLSSSCQFYNEEIHRAVFALPNFMKALVCGQSLSQLGVYPTT